MDNERRERLKNAWDHESEAPESMEWRDELSPEELDVVSKWDRSYSRGVLAMCSAILVRERVRARFSPEEIEELETVYDQCVLRTCSGGQYIARLDKDGQIVLEEVG